MDSKENMEKQLGADHDENMEEGLGYTSNINNYLPIIMVFLKGLIKNHAMCLPLIIGLLLPLWMMKRLHSI